MLQEKAISNFFHGKSATTLIMVACCCCALVAWQKGAVKQITDYCGLGLPSTNSWIPFGVLSTAVNLGVNLLIALLFVYITRLFNILRSLTDLGGTMFLAMQIALPTVLCQLCEGTLLALVALTCVWLLFAVNGDRHGQREVFLIFFLLTTAAFTQWAFLLFVPVFLLGCAQMRILDMRTFMAALFGVITPPWILFGLGIVNTATLHLPHLTMVWNDPPDASTIKMMAILLITITLGVFFTIANLMKILSYNSRVRAFNGFLTMLLIFTALFTVINFNDFTLYVPLLNCLVAYQIGHFFTYRRSKRSYIPVLLIMLLYLALYIWEVFI